MRIILAAPSYNPSIGGAVVFHKLCDILLYLGYDAYLTTTPKLNGNNIYFNVNSKYKHQLASEFDPKQDIIFYPEIEPGNPFGGEKVVRYILNKFHLPEYDNIVGTWDDKDFWIYFHEKFYDGLRPKNFLHVIDSNLDIFRNHNEDRYLNSCHTYRKQSGNKNKIIPIHPSNSIEIPYGMTNNQLALLFNNCKRFYSYDNETFLSIQAALCGCESVVVPLDGISKEEALLSQPSFKYGIAYGLDDLELAKSTQHLLRQELINIEHQQITKVDIMIKKIINYFE